jgi:hypothetical protein
MHLLNSFPEIHAFFKRDRFDSDDLGRLKQLITERYLDKDLRKKANSLLALEMLKFNILQEHPEQRKELKVKDKVPQPRHPKKNHEAKPSRFQEVQPKRNRVLKPLFQISYDTSFPTNIENLSIKLKLSRVEITALCARKDISLKGKPKLTDDELKKMIPIFQKRIGEIRAQERKEAERHLPKNKEEVPVKHKKYVSSHHGGVFDEIAKHGLGKLIYIRSR